MAKFISIPTQVVGQPNILFNTDNIIGVFPPPADSTTVYFRLLSQDKEYRLTMCGVDAAAQNANAIAAQKIVAKTFTSASAAPTALPVLFPSVLLSQGAGATGQTTITVASTAGLVAGMAVTVVSGGGAFALNTRIASVTNGTQFVVSTAPTTTLAGAEIVAATLTVQAFQVS
jgi:hypothetical protein